MTLTYYLIDIIDKIDIIIDSWWNQGKIPTFHPDEKVAKKPCSTAEWTILCIMPLAYLRLPVVGGALVPLLNGPVAHESLEVPSKPVYIDGVCEIICEAELSV